MSHFDAAVGAGDLVAQAQCVAIMAELDQEKSIAQVNEHVPASGANTQVGVTDHRPRRWGSCQSLSVTCKQHAKCLVEL